MMIGSVSSGTTTKYEKNVASGAMRNFMLNISDKDMMCPTAICSLIDDAAKIGELKEIIHGVRGGDSLHFRS
ncbi:hypothetical protein PGB90_009277 [Kerria lacca]